MACTEPANDAAVGTRPCQLEALNTDCVMAILRASNSLADLGAFIRASPTILRCFFSAKFLILRDVMINELGPVIRDAFIMSHTDNLDMFAAGTVKQTFDIIIRAYRERLLTDRAPWVPPLDDDTAADMARLTRLVLDIVDLYTSLRRRHFREALDPPCGEWDASQTERRRIAQALMRSQVLASLHHPTFDMSEEGDSFFATAVSLFESWELEQMSAMAHFVADLIHALRQLDKHWRRSRPRSLPALYVGLVLARRSNDTFLGELRRELRLCGGKMCDGGLPIRWLWGSHRWVWVREGVGPVAH